MEVHLAGAEAQPRASSTASKPHIRRRFGIWFCALRGRWERWNLLIAVPPYGHGRTPLEAFRDWEAQQ